MSLSLRGRSDNTLPVVGLILSIVGLVMVLSASQFFAADRFGNPYYFFNRQLIFWIIGVGAYFYFLKVPLETLFIRRPGWLITIFILLVLVFIPFVGPEVAGVNRWIGWGAMRFQPAELVKLLLVIYLSAWLAAKGKLVSSPIQGLLPFIIILASVGFLVISEPDMGTTTVLVLIALGIFLVAGADLFQFIALLIVGGVLMLLLVSAAPYRVQRLNVFLNRNYDSSQALGEAYHSQQALIAIGSGGIWGVGFGQGTSKYAYLPESHTDSIFAVMAEELGYLRVSLVPLLFLFIGWRGYLIARSANSQFVRLLATGITVSLLSQAIINISGMLNVLPLTGVPLPFISYGGSSLITSMASLGLLTNISRETNG